MAGGTFLQNDEAAASDQEIPGNQRQCCQSAGLGRTDYVFATGDSSISIQVGMGNTRSDGGFDGGLVL